MICVDRTLLWNVIELAGDGGRRANRVVRGPFGEAPGRGRLEDLLLHPRAPHWQRAPGAPGKPRHQRLLLAQPQRPQRQVH